jgi:hypothetical protein
MSALARSVLIRNMSAKCKKIFTSEKITDANIFFFNTLKEFLNKSVENIREDFKKLDSGTNELVDIKDKHNDIQCKFEEEMSRLNKVITGGSLSLNEALIYTDYLTLIKNYQDEIKEIIVPHIESSDNVDTENEIDDFFKDDEAHLINLICKNLKISLPIFNSRLLILTPKLSSKKSTGRRMGISLESSPICIAGRGGKAKKKTKKQKKKTKKQKLKSGKKNKNKSKRRKGSRKK